MSSWDTPTVWNWRTYEQALSDLEGLPPGERLQALLTEWRDEAELLSIEDMRKLFVYAWPDGRESVDDDPVHMLRLLRFIAPVRDHETYLSGTLPIFHAGADGHGIRWTLDEAAATAEAAGAPIFRATVAASDVLAHFTGDGRNEVLVDWQDLSGL